MAGPEPRNTVHAESAAQLHEKRYDQTRHKQGLFSIAGSKPESHHSLMSVPSGWSVTGHDRADSKNQTQKVDGHASGSGTSGTCGPRNMDQAGLAQGCIDAVSVSFCAADRVSALVRRTGSGGSLSLRNGRTPAYIALLCMGFRSG